MATSYFYSYITTTSYRTTYTIMVPLKQSRYSLMGEWWESDDGWYWRKVTSSWGRRATEDCKRWTVICNGIGCDEYICSRLTGGWRPLNPEVPRISYHRYNETLTLQPSSEGYTLEGRSADCYFDWDIGECVIRYTEWGRTYKLQAIELVDWDTGEVYASVNQTSLTFNINANTIVRFKYVLVDSWSRSWVVILQPPTPEPTPDECQQILNDPSKRCTGAWCSCLKTYDPEAWKKEECCPTQKLICLSVHVTPCCSGDAHDACLNSWSGRGGTGCISCRDDSECASRLPVTVSWSASWRLKPGWAVTDIGKTGYGPAECGLSSLTGSSASGSCKLTAVDHAVQWVVVIFKRT